MSDDLAPSHSRLPLPNWYEAFHPLPIVGGVSAVWRATANRVLILLTVALGIAFFAAGAIAVVKSATFAGITIGVSATLLAGGLVRQASLYLFARRLYYYSRRSEHFDGETFLRLELSQAARRAEMLKVELALYERFLSRAKDQTRTATRVSDKSVAKDSDETFGHDEADDDDPGESTR